jgi:NAD(P) transhydrogenase subunit beta
MTAMPQMIAIYNGMGGGAAAAIAAVELLKDHGDKATAPHLHPGDGRGRRPDRRGVVLRLGGGVRQVAGTQILQGRRQVPLYRPTESQRGDLFGWRGMLGLVIAISHSTSGALITIFFLLALAFGAMMACPSAARICRW